MACPQEVSVHLRCFPADDQQLARRGWSPCRPSPSSTCRLPRHPRAAPRSPPGLEPPLPLPSQSSRRARSLHSPHRTRIKIIAAARPRPHPRVPAGPSRVPRWCRRECALAAARLPVKAPGPAPAHPSSLHAAACHCHAPCRCRWPDPMVAVSCSALRRSRLVRCRGSPLLQDLQQSMVGGSGGPCPGLVARHVWMDDLHPGTKWGRLAGSRRLYPWLTGLFSTLLIRAPHGPIGCSGF
ncbi:hypothetical protein SEVIR_7G102950v4 [Setaria viridis]